MDWILEMVFYEKIHALNIFGVYIDYPESRKMNTERWTPIQTLKVLTNSIISCK